MKAFIHEYNTISKMPRSGSDHATVTNEYKNVPNMYKYAIKPFMKSHKSDVLVEIFYNWQNRYGTPDEILVYSFTKEGMILCETLPRNK